MFPGIPEIPNVLILPRSPFPACTDVVIFSLFGWAGGLLVVHGGLLTIIRGLVRAGHITPQRPELHVEAASGPEAETILAMSNKLLTEITLRRVRSVQTIAWSENQPWYWCSFKRQGFRNPPQLVLCARFRGMLRPEE